MIKKILYQIKQQLFDQGYCEEDILMFLQNKYPVKAEFIVPGAALGVIGVILFGCAITCIYCICDYTKDLAKIKTQTENYRTFSQPDANIP